MTALSDIVTDLDRSAAGWRMHALAAELYPICRSITGPGFRETIARVGSRIPLQVTEVESGSAVFDWTVPPEWTVREAWVRGPDGRSIVDFRDHNLHLVGFSAPFRGVVSRAELDVHLHSLPSRPHAIPYRTTYYERKWGFCLRHADRERLPEGQYEVCVDTALEPGALVYAEHVHPGDGAGEILLSCHACHPALANDNLSGIALVTELAARLAGVRTRHTIRILLAPGTIGAIAWLARHPDASSRVRHGLVVACVGDRGPLHYKRTLAGRATIDRACEHVLGASGAPFEVRDFDPYGYDERQYNSPAFRLAVGSLTRTPHGRYPEYHTSDDDLSLLDPEALGGSLAAYLEVLEVLDSDRRYVNTNPHGEPQLGRRGLYAATGGLPDPGVAIRAMLWVLTLSDGAHSLLDVAERSGMPYRAILSAARALEASGLLVPAEIAAC